MLAFDGRKEVSPTFLHPMSTMNPSRLEALKQEIEAAFAGVPYPGDEHIAYSNIDFDGSRVAAAFKGKHWKELTPDELHWNEMNFLSPAGLHFYLPAYLLASLEDYNGTLNEDIRPLSVYGLTLNDEDTPRNRRIRESQLKEFAAFSPAQKRAIRAFLEYARDEWTDEFPGGDEPKQALERYWSRDWP
jgi:hypothetical protein